MTATHDQQRYRLSFTAGALYLRGAPIGAALYQDLGDWLKVRAALRADNLLQARTTATSTRWTAELVRRLATLTNAEIEILTEATGEEEAHLMWAATCRYYSLIGEFAEEVLRERFLLLQPTVTPAHFNAFVSKKTLWHDELTTLRPATYRALRSNLLRMLREADLITEDGTIIPTAFSARVRAQFDRRTPSDARFFPTKAAA